MRCGAGSSSADQENDARVASALSKAALAEAHTATAQAEARAVKAEAEARVANLEARAVKAEAKAEARIAKAEADARVSKAEAEATTRVAQAEKQLEHERLLRQVTEAHTLLAAEHSKVLALKGERHLRGAVELVAERAAAQLLSRGVRVGAGVQSTLNAVLQRDAKLRAVLALLAERHHERLSAVEKCLQNVYHGLSAPFHSTDGNVLVQEVVIAVGAARCAVCGLLEAYDVPYTYYGPSGEEAQQSPYALSAEERAAAATRFDTLTTEEVPATAAP